MQLVPGNSTTSFYQVQVACFLRTALDFDVRALQHQEHWEQRVAHETGEVVNRAPWARALEIPAHFDRVCERKPQ